jgi:hypothetical protein
MSGTLLVICSLEDVHSDGVWSNESQYKPGFVNFGAGKNRLVSRAITFWITKLFAQRFGKSSHQGVLIRRYRPFLLDNFCSNCVKKYRSMVLGAPSDASDVNYCVSQPRWRHVAHPQNNSLGTFFRTMETLNFFRLLFSLVSNIWASRGDENEVEATTSSNELFCFRFSCIGAGTMRGKVCSLTWAISPDKRVMFSFFFCYWLDLRLNESNEAPVFRFVAIFSIVLWL